MRGSLEGIAPKAESTVLTPGSGNFRSEVGRPAGRTVELACAPQFCEFLVGYPQDDGRSEVEHRIPPPCRKHELQTQRVHGLQSRSRVRCTHTDSPQRTRAVRAHGPDSAYYALRLRGASNAKAKKEFGFAPRRIEWLVRQPSRLIECPGTNVLGFSFSSEMNMTK